MDMPFDETNINRAQDGRFSDKLGSAPTIELRQWPSQFIRFDRDAAEADAIYDIFLGYAKLMKVSSKGSVVRQARHLIQGMWQGPRLAGPMVGRIRPVNVPWSPGARDAYFAGDTNGTLCLEHMTPMKVYVGDLMERVEDGEICDGESMLNHLRRTHERSTVFSILSGPEDKAVSKAKFKDRLPDDGDPWGRYEAGGINRDSFMTLAEDPRWALHQRA